MTMMTRLLVNRSNFGEARIEEAALPVPGEGEVLVKTGAFGLTANNVSYALSGDMIGYWKFFPVAEEGWGIVPVWGFAEVIASHCPDLPVGSRFWGFLPMATHLVMRPDAVTAEGFVDAVEHRRPLPDLYNRYQRTERDPPAMVAAADARSVLFPLLFTGWVLADYLEDNDYFGAEQVVIGSASSKTALGNAHYIGQLASRSVELIGLTSQANADFVRGTDFYDQVLGYDAVAELSAHAPTVFVDMSGNGTLVAAIHRHFGDNLKASIAVGATHWDAPRNRQALPGPAPSFFFAPGQVLKREQDWGPGEIMRRIAAANLQFLPTISAMVSITHYTGADAVKQQYEAMAANAVPPANALILSF